MTITVNGAAREADAGRTVADWLAAAGLDPARVAVEYNAALLARADFANQILSAGDSLEVVHFVGGG